MDLGGSFVPVAGDYVAFVPAVLPHADALPILVEVLEQEAEDRRIRRVDRLRRASKLPAGKTWDTFEHERAPVKLRQQLVRLAEGDFVDRDVMLAFGLPGTGKTHAMCAIGHRLVQSGRSVLFIPAYRLVQDMLAAKRDLDLPRMLRKLDNYDLLVIDPAAGGRGVGGAVHSVRAYRRSLGITSNLVFSEWEKVFSKMATAAAIRVTRSSSSSTWSYRPVKHRGDRRKNDNYKRQLHQTPSGQSNWRKAARITVVDQSPTPLRDNKGISYSHLR